MMVAFVMGDCWSGNAMFMFQETDKVFGTPGLLSNRAVAYSLGVEQAGS